MANSFDLAQTAFIFSWVSNYSSYKKSSEKDLAQYVESCLTSSSKNPFSGKLNAPHILDNASTKDRLFGGGWKLAWSPGVLCSIEQNAKNTAYIVENEKYAILAVAGTNPHSFWDWFKEDGRVGKEDNIDWDDFLQFDLYNHDPDLTLLKKNASDKEQISLGTATGVKDVLRNLHSSSGNRTSLVEYLAGIPATGKQLIVTGHSLGGALSPTLARYILEKYGTKFSAIHAMPTAGPTPGNVAYQTCWDGKFKPVTSGSKTLVEDFNKNVFCTHDVVPHAWRYILEAWKDEKRDPHNAKMFNYFYGELDYQKLQINLAWPGGVIDYTTAFALGKPILAARAKGISGNMGTAKNLTGFELKNYFSILEKAGDGEAKTKVVDVYKEGFLDAIAQIHVWSYGQEAFQIPIEFWGEIYPRTVVN